MIAVWSGQSIAWVQLRVRIRTAANGGTTLGLLDGGNAGAKRPGSEAPLRAERDSR